MERKGVGYTGGKDPATGCTCSSRLGLGRPALNLLLFTSHTLPATLPSPYALDGYSYSSISPRPVPLAQLIAPGGRVSRQLLRLVNEPLLHLPLEELPPPLRGPDCPAEVFAYLLEGEAAVAGGGGEAAGVIVVGADSAGGAASGVA